MKKIIFVEGIDNCGKTTLLTHPKFRELAEAKGNIYYGVMPDGIWRPILKGLNKFFGPNHPITKNLYWVYHFKKLREIEKLISSNKYDYLIFDRSFFSYIAYNCVSEDIDFSDLPILSRIYAQYMMPLTNMVVKYGWEVVWVYLYPLKSTKELKDIEKLRHHTYLSLIKGTDITFNNKVHSTKIIRSRKLERRIKSLLSVF